MTEPSKTDRCAVIIPAYNPSPLLVALVQELRTACDLPIVVVDDGSQQPGARDVFAALAQLPITLLRHPHNRGKGAALKTAFAHCLGTGVAAVVTADADGQHAVADILRVAAAATTQRFEKVILGVREFGADTPLRSRFGNTMTRWLFRLRTGLAISDTQTGLRCFPATLLPQLMELPGDRYEYESYMLLFMARRGIALQEVPIATIYLDHNASSHFRPIVDSMRIYWLLFRDVLTAVASFLIDIALFSALVGGGLGISQGTYAARFCSAIFNFLACKYWVFRRPELGSLLVEAVKYTLLAIVLALLSAHLVQWLVDSGVTGGATTSKILVDGGLYVASFLIRKYFVFPLRKNSVADSKP